MLPAIVGLGSSAGGLDALKEFFRAMPADSGMVFVIVQHLDPTHGSLMAELIGRCTAMRVLEVDADMPAEADHVYCIPPGKYLTISERTLRVTPQIERGSVRMPIDFFLRTLATDAQERGIGIILSGTGTDGTLGLRAVKAAGGLAMVQYPATAQHDGMPRSAIAAGAVDAIVAPGEMPGILLQYLRHPYATRKAAAEIDRDHLHDVLAILRERMNFDFRIYKRSTLERRIARRMGLRHVEHVADYTRLLASDAAEVTRLFEDFLISVTSFFRDPEAWRLLQEKVIRPLVARKDAHAPLRVWVPGCATGEEAYSIGIVLIEEMLAAGKNGPVQIFASDVDLSALDFARIGLYPDSILADVSPERQRRFFVQQNHTARVVEDLRESVVFARQNLVADPPFSRLDLICCRNVLMYFEPEAQNKVVSLLHFALDENGYLFLGSAETVGQQEDIFESVSKKWRIYRRVGPTRHDRVQFPGISGSALHRLGDPSPIHPTTGRLGALAQQLLLERFVPACVLINRRCEILYFAGATQDYLVQPTGIPTQNLLSRAREGLQTRLRAAIRRAVDDGQRNVASGARVRRADAWHRVRITVEPLGGSRETDGLLLVSFADDPSVEPPAPEAAGAGETAEPVVRQLENELKTTRDDLQSTIEELEGSNQELKVANEEVMSVNEELRSSNEELETSKEALQSLNEELNSVNTQLEEKVGQLERVSNDLDNLLTSTAIATIFLDTDFHVRRFTPAATRLFNLIATDVGRPIGDIAQRFTDPELRRDTETVLADLVPISKEVQAEDGRWYVRQALPYRTHDNRIEGVVITFSDVAAEALQEARLYAEAIVDTVREPLLVLHADLSVFSANRSFYETFSLSSDETIGRPVYQLGNHELDVPKLRELLGDILPSARRLEDFEVEHEFARIGPRTLLLNARTLVRGAGRPDLILLAFDDITERKRAEHALRESEAMTRAGVQTAMDGVVTIDEHGTLLSFNPAAERIFGYAAGEVIGQNVEMLIPNRDGHDHYLTRHPKTGERQLTGNGREVSGRRKDGTPFPLDLHLSEFADERGRRFVGTIRNITERKRTEEQMRRQQAELAHVLRTATIEHLAAGLAHELNQPLAAIANDLEACATYVRSGERGAPRLLELLDRAGAETLRAGEIVHHLREFVKRREPRLESTDLCEIVRNATRWLLRDMEQERIALRLELVPGGLRVSADRVQIEQVLVNLMQNAIDSIREAGTETREICIRASQTEDGKARVAVDDTGAGFNPAALERLYEPFFTTKPQGMGMGLAICRSIVEMHDGRLSVAPRATGGGTTVQLALPLEAAPRTEEESA